MKGRRKLNIVEVFQEKVVMITEKRLKLALEKLKKDEHLKRKFRELADTSSRLERVREICKDDDSNRDSWLIRLDELNKKRDEIYSELKDRGFEYSWIKTIVNYEMEKLDRILIAARENARMEIFGKLDIKDIDDSDNRWELVSQKMKHARDTYFAGE